MLGAQIMPLGSHIFEIISRCGEDAAANCWSEGHAELKYDQAESSTIGIVYDLAQTS